MEVGTFGADSGAVDYVELVRGTPWAPRSAAQQQPELLVSTQQRDFSWHWTRAPTSAAHTQGPPMLQRGAAGSSEGRPCGGVEAEALWLFACSKEAGIKVFRFVWSIEEASGCGGGTETGKDSSCKETGRSAGDRQGLLGRWCCALTIRGRCQLVSLDLNNGIVAVCTPRDSRVCFVCFSVRLKIPKQPNALSNPYTSLSCWILAVQSVCENTKSLRTLVWRLFCIFMNGDTVVVVAGIYELVLVDLYSTPQRCVCKAESREWAFRPGWVLRVDVALEALFVLLCGLSASASCSYLCLTFWGEPRAGGGGPLEVRSLRPAAAAACAIGRLFACAAAAVCCNAAFSSGVCASRVAGGEAAFFLAASWGPAVGSCRRVCDSSGADED